MCIEHPLSSGENEHMSYFGADSYSDYKEFLKGNFVKDPESKNLVPGIIVSNASPNSNDQDSLMVDSILNMVKAESPNKKDTPTTLTKSDSILSAEIFSSFVT